MHGQGGKGDGTCPFIIIFQRVFFMNVIIIVVNFVFKN
jgi:hypothetical protein